MMNTLKFDINNSIGQSFCDSLNGIPKPKINRFEAPKLEIPRIPVKGIYRTLSGMALMGTLLSACAGGAKASTYKAPDIAAEKAATIELFCSGSQTVTDWEGREYQIPEKCGDVTFGNSGITVLPIEMRDRTIGVASFTLDGYDPKTGRVTASYDSVRLHPQLSDCAAQIVAEKEYELNAIAREVLSKAGLYNNDHIKIVTDANGVEHVTESNLVGYLADAMAVDFMADGLTLEDRKCLQESGIDPRNYHGTPETSIFTLTSDGKLSDKEICGLANDALKQIKSAGSWYQESVTKDEIEDLVIGICEK